MKIRRMIPVSVISGKYFPPGSAGQGVMKWQTLKMVPVTARVISAVRNQYPYNPGLAERLEA